MNTQIYVRSFYMMPALMAVGRHNDCGTPVGRHNGCGTPLLGLSVALDKLSRTLNLASIFFQFSCCLCSNVYVAVKCLKHDTDSASSYACVYI